MSRRKDRDGPRSTSWESYRPQDPLYWRSGGPFVPVAAIEPEPFDARYVATHLKNANTKARFLASEVRRIQKDLAESTAYYLLLQELGIDAMKLQYYRDQDRKLDAEPGDWMMVARNVDRHRASSYQNIRMRMGQIAAYGALLAVLPAQPHSLFEESDDE